jgi:hypothetical protein
MALFASYQLLWQAVCIQAKATLGYMMTRKSTSKSQLFYAHDQGTNSISLAIEYALETTSVGDVPLQIQKYEIPTNANPYLLPWIMRGLLEEEFVKTELDTEVTELLKQFDEWKPATKVLKDVKYRLEAVRSKL